MAQPAHSLLALTIAELGITGLIVFALMWGRWFQMSLTFLFRRSSDIVSRLGLGLGLGLLGCFVHNLTEWGWRYIEVYLIFHFFAGMLAALYHMRDKPGMMAGSGDWQRNRVPIPGRPE